MNKTQAPMLEFYFAFIRAKSLTVSARLIVYYGIFARYADIA